MTDAYVIGWIKDALSQAIIQPVDKTKMNGYSSRADVLEALESLATAHSKGGITSVQKAWKETIGAYIPDVAAIVNRPKLIRHISEFENTPAIEWLVKDEIPKKSTVIIYGASGAAKSFAAVDYAGQIAKTENIIYIAGEGESGYYARYNAWLKHCGYTKPGKFNLLPKAIQMLKNDDVENFITEAAPLKPAAVFIDTLARCMVGGDENSQKDMGMFIYACDQIRERLDCTVVIIHHTGKAGDNERGSSSLRGAADMMIAITNEEGVIKIACGKSKDTKPFTHRYCRLQEVEIVQNKVPIVSCVLEAWQRVKVDPKDLSPNQARLLECLSSELFHEGVRAPDLKAYSNVQGSGFYTSLNSLIKRGYARKMGKGAKIDPVVITHEGMEWIRAKSKVNPEQMSVSMM